MVSFSTSPIENEDYNFATGKEANLKNLKKSTNNQSLDHQTDLIKTKSSFIDQKQQFNGFVVIYSQIDDCCGGKDPCVAVNSDELNDNFLCACSESLFTPDSCPSK